MVLFFTYFFVSLIILLTSVVFLCCYISFIYVGSFLIVFCLLFCVSSSFFILVLLSFNFFTGYGTTYKVNNLLIENGGHSGSSMEVFYRIKKVDVHSTQSTKLAIMQHIFLQNTLVLPPRKLILISFKIQSYLQNVTWMIFCGCFWDGIQYQSKLSQAGQNLTPLYKMES